MGLKNLFQDFKFYGIVDFLQRSVGVIMIPYYTRVLSTADYGNFDLFIIVSSTLLVLIDFQFIAALNRLFYEYAKIAKDKRLIGTILMFRLFIGIVIGSLTLFLGNSGFLEFKFIPSFIEYKYIWILIVLLPIVTSCYDGLIAHSRIIRSKQIFSIISFASIITSASLAVLLLEFYNLGITGILVAMILGKSIAIIIGFILIGKQIDFCIDLKILKSIFSYSLPLVPSWWFAFLTTYFGRFFTYSELGPEKSAVLAITMKLLLLINFFALAFRSAWLPIAMSYIGEDNEDNFYINSNRVLLISLMSMSVILILSIDIIVDIALPPEYFMVGLIFPIFITSSIISEVEVNLQLGCQIAKKTIWISIGSFVSFVVSVLILYLLVPLYNLYAIGLSLLFGSVVKIIITYIASQKNRFIEYDFKSMFLFVLGISVILVYAILNNFSIVSGTLLKLMLCIFGVLFLVKTINKHEFLLFYHRIIKYINRID